MMGVIIILMGSFIAIALSYDWQGRIGTWKNRIENYTSSDGGDSYQVSQAKIAIVSGGLVKLRPGKSIQRNFLPHPYSDFIYAIIIEEYGLVGGAVVLVLYLWLLFRCSRSGKKELTNLSCLSCHWPGGNDYLPGHHQHGRGGKPASCYRSAPAHDQHGWIFAAIYLCCPGHHTECQPRNQAISRK